MTRGLWCWTTSASQANSWHNSCTHYDITGLADSTRFTFTVPISIGQVLSALLAYDQNLSTIQAIVKAYSTDRFLVTVHVCAGILLGLLLEALLLK